MSNYGQTLITVETLHSLVKYYKMKMKLMIGKPLSLNNGHEVKLQYNSECDETTNISNAKRDLLT